MGTPFSDSSLGHARFRVQAEVQWKVWLPAVLIPTSYQSRKADEQAKGVGKPARVGPASTCAPEPGCPNRNDKPVGDSDGIAGGRGNRRQYGDLFFRLPAGTNRHRRARQTDRKSTRLNSSHGHLL